MGTLMLPSCGSRSGAANQAIVAAGLVTLSFGNASGVDRDAGVLLIKPSGVPYDVLRPEDLVAVVARGRAVVEGTCGRRRTRRRTSRSIGASPSIGGVVHTHSTAAIAWAQAGRRIPALGTTHADHFHGPVPVTRPLTQRRDRGRVRGTRPGRSSPRRSTASGSTRSRCRRSWSRPRAVHLGRRRWRRPLENAVALEAVAAMAAATLALNPAAEPDRRVPPRPALPAQARPRRLLRPAR